jgi:hypothetical protein
LAIQQAKTKSALSGKTQPRDHYRSPIGCCRKYSKKEVSWNQTRKNRIEINTGGIQMEEQELKVKGKLEIEDISNITWSKINRPYILLTLLVTLVFINKFEMNSTEEVIFYFGLLILAIRGVMYFVLKLLTKWSYKKNKYTKMETEYFLSNAGMKIINEDENTRISWGKIDKVSIIKNYFIFYVSGGKSYWVSKRWFETGENVNAFDRILRSNLSKNKILNSYFRNLFCSLRKISFWLFIIILIISVTDYYATRTETKEVSYTQFFQRVEEKKINRVIIVNNQFYGVLKSGDKITTFVPEPSSVINFLRKNKVDITFSEPPPPPWWKLGAKN